VPGENELVTFGGKVGERLCITREEIVAVLAMRQMDTSLWELLDRPGIETKFPALREQMLPDAALAGNPQ